MMAKASIFRWLSVIMVAATALLYGRSIAADQPTSSTSAKPLVILLFDGDMAGCESWNSQIRPLLKELKGEYTNQLNFTELNMAKSQLAETKKRAKELGVLRWIDGALGDKDYCPTVMFFDSTRRRAKLTVGPKSKDVYKRDIETILETNERAAPGNSAALD
jgi:hypothetical protein